MKQHKLEKHKPLLETEQSETALPNVIHVAIRQTPESHEVMVHRHRTEDPDRLAEQAAGIGAVTLNREFRVPAEIQAEDEIQQRWNNYDPNAQ